MVKYSLKLTQKVQNLHQMFKKASKRTSTRLEN